MDDNTFSALILVYIVWTAFQGWKTYQHYLAWRWGNASRNWPHTSARIAVSGTMIEGTWYQWKRNVRVIYAYVVDDVTYNASRLWFGNRWLMTNNEARRIAIHYKPDAIVRVFYHPKNPRLAVLRPGIDKLTQTIETIGVVLATGFWAWFTWLLVKSL